MSVLLTDEAVRAAAAHLAGVLGAGTTPTAADRHRAHAALWAGLHYHATEGREALVEQIQRTLSYRLDILDAETIVTALFGPESVASGSQTTRKGA